MRLLFLLLSFFPLLLKAQVWHTRYTIPWTHSIAGADVSRAEAYLEFRFMNYKNYDALLPEWSELIPWENGKPQPNVKLFSAEYELIPEMEGLSKYTADLKTDISVYSKILYAQKKANLQISLIPFRLNPDNGKPERLKSFVVTIESGQGMVYSEPVLKKSSVIKNSILSSGKWFKIQIPKTGIYKLTYEQLSSIGLSDPANVRVFGWGGSVLPENAGEGTQDDLNPTQIFMSKGADNKFGPGDFILFYGIGPVGWKYDSIDKIYRHQLNPYAEYGYYFLTASMGVSDFPTEASLIPDEPDYITSSYDFRDYHEKELENFIQSGREWYGEDFYTSNLQRTFDFSVPGMDTDKPVRIVSRLLAQSVENSSFYIYGNEQLLDTVNIRYANPGDYTSTYAYTGMALSSFKATGENVRVKYKYNHPEPAAKGWLDYIIVNARAKLELKNGVLYFRDSQGTGLTEFNLNNTGSSTVIWDVSDIHDIRAIQPVLNGSMASFKTTADPSSEFLAFNPAANFPSPQIQGTGLGLIDNQDLHGSGFPDMVIVVHPDFMESAVRLAEHRREYNNLEVIVTTPDIIYNEFSSGRPDVTAIRNYMRYLYKNAGTDASLLPQYLLLFGDGSYFYKTDDPNKKSRILTYQSVNSLSPTISYVSDDYYAILDDGEGMYDGLLDIGVGRLPVNSAKGAELMADKIILYDHPDRMGDWRNTICFIGDDEDYNTHFNQANQLAEYVTDNYPNFNVNKIFLDAYKQVSTPVGQRYPDVNQAINEQIAKGALIINYTGHGGTGGLAHEKILELNDIITWENYNKLPLFMTATCEFSRYDKPDMVTAGEEVILNSRGGGIALLTTTRLVYSGPNHALNERFYEIVFEKDSANNDYSLGDILKYSKNKTGAGVNKRNFTLLGDPAMKLTYPYYKINTDSINNMALGEYPDTISALQKVTISGHIENMEGKLHEGFNGIVYPVVYDKKSLQSTLANDGGSKQTFTLRNNIVYKGSAEVKEGRFSFSFIVPKDIGYAFGIGKLSYYAADSINDAAGSSFNLIIGGASKDAAIDNTGPEIEVYMNTYNFRAGGITDENPVLLLKVFDEHGVNTSGGIGHDITANLNDNAKNLISLNDYYLSDPGSYKSGRVEYPFSKLEEGRHTVSVKVWDVYNNSSTAYTDFVVVKSEDMIIKNIMNYPNPFSDYTKFSFEHNKPSVDLDITIDIMDMSGTLIKTLKAKQYQSGYISEPIIWNISDGNSNINRQGIYIYNVRVNTSDGYEVKGSGKLIMVQ